MFKVNNKETSPTLLALTYFRSCSNISIVNFEHVIAGWDSNKFLSNICFCFNHNLVIPLKFIGLLPQNNNWQLKKI